MYNLRQVLRKYVENVEETFMGRKVVCIVLAELVDFPSSSNDRLRFLAGDSFGKLRAICLSTGDISFIFDNLYLKSVTL